MSDTPPDTEIPPPEEPRRLSAKLARLRIAGFKSFAESTLVEIMPGLTGIVGPNGCGKSNVVESLRWAMGESSARSLRGGEMDDVIFAGTSTRPARNLAEVTIFLEEAPGVAPAPLERETELEIVRRLTRGEGSSYRINGREVRQRDVQTMFADLASGPRANGMVSQGRVSQLIAAKPEERRTVLEEAAGISGLRARKHEAELKLRQAENNLARAEDLVAQLDAQQESLGRQAKQAARYRNISGLIRDAEAALLALQVARAALAMDAAEKAAQEARASTRAAEAEAERATIAHYEAERAIPTPRMAEAEARTALERRRIEAEGVEAALARAVAALEGASNTAAQLSADLAHAQAVEEDAKANETRLTREDAGLASAESALPARLAETETLLASTEAEARAREAAAETATQHAAEAAAQANQVASELAFAEQRHGRLAEQAQRLVTEHAAAEAAAVPPEALEQAAAAVIAAETRLSEARAALETAEAARIATAA
ncbi:AAA family ATPase, partial [Rhodovarius lipocyclicus]|uniref:AAA family ATPase n=1 Tax=Rhodovarius lipocyclicus TaxID=268410 RepID=UPI00135A28DF